MEAVATITQDEVATVKVHVPLLSLFNDWHAQNLLIWVASTVVHPLYTLVARPEGQLASLLNCCDAPAEATADRPLTGCCGCSTCSHTHRQPALIKAQQAPLPVPPPHHQGPGDAPEGDAACLCLPSCSLANNTDPGLALTGAPPRPGGHCGQWAVGRCVPKWVLCPYIELDAIIWDDLRGQRQCWQDVQCAFSCHICSCHQV